MRKKKPTWKDDQPIYRQIRDTLIARILDGTYQEQELLPSVRQLAEEFGVSPLTAAKVLQEVHKEGLTQTHRGIGTEVSAGSREKLLRRERKHFMDKEWPALQKRLQRMEIDVRDLLRST